MRLETRHALSAFFYTISLFFSPMAFLIGLMHGGLQGYAVCVFSLLSLSIGYVFTSLPKVPLTNKEAIYEIIFWTLFLGEIVIGFLVVINKSWVAFSILLVLGGILLLIWERSTDKVKNRIKHAPLIYPL